MNEQIIRIESQAISVCLTSEQVFIHNDAIELKGLSYRLLLALLKHSGNVVSNSELAQEVWNKNYVSDETIAQRVSIVRKAINDTTKTMIESVRGEGYRWKPPVAFVESLADEETTVLAQVKPKRQAIKKRYVIVLALLITVALIVLSTGKLSKSESLQEKADIAESKEKHTGDNTNDSPLFQKAVRLSEQKSAESNQLAIELLHGLLIDEPDNDKAKFLLSVCYIEQVIKYNGNQELLIVAEQHIKKLNDKNFPHWMILKLKGYLADAKGELQRSIWFYEQALTAEGGAERVAPSLAYLYVRQGKLYEALNLNIRYLNVNQPYAYLQIAEILMLAELAPEYEQWLSYAYRLAPNDSFTVVLYAKNLMLNGQYDKASQALLTLENFNSNNQDSALMQANIEFAEGKWQQAQKTLEDACRLEERNIYCESLKFWVEKAKLNITDVNKTYVNKTNSVAPEFELNEESWPSSHIAQSIIYIALEDFSMATLEIEKAVNKGFLDYRYLQNMPMFSALKTDQKFLELMMKIRHSVKTERLKVSSIELPKVN